MSSRTARVLREIAEVKTHDTTSSIRIHQPSDADLFRLIGSFAGPDDTPYEGGLFEVDIRIPR